MAHQSSVTVGSKRTLEYVLECLARFNRGSDTLTLKAVEQSISQAVTVAQLLKKYFQVEIGPARLRRLDRAGRSFSSIEISLTCTATPGGKGDFSADRHARYVPFAIYQLLVDALLSTEREVDVEVPENYEDDGEFQGDRPGELWLRVARSENGFHCALGERLIPQVGTGADSDQLVKPLGALAAVFSRCGLLLSPRWEQVSSRLAESDDVILGIDTNLLTDCVVTQQLLDGFTHNSRMDHIQTPNWVLLIIPHAVMHEIEQAANSRTGWGKLTMVGRLGYRGLQEILEIDQCRDMRGITALIVGQADPVMDTRVELQGLREDFKKAQPEHIQRKLFHKMSAGDTIIRDQIKVFLRQIGFHKGAFFLTGDKSNSALAQAEGLHSIYYELVPWSTLLRGQRLEPPVVDYTGEDGAPERLSLPVLTGKLWYELAVQFGTIRLHWSTGDLELGSDNVGESLDHWTNRLLRIKPGTGWQAVLKNYDRVGRFSLTQALEAWEEINAHTTAEP